MNRLETRSITRRQFVNALGAGLLIVVSAPLSEAQVRGNRRFGGGRGRGKPVSIAARIHIAQDGTITVMTGKVECGQGARAELTQAAAEELGVNPSDIHLVMADTQLAPDDGMTAGSRTTPSTVPAVRQGAAAAREALIAIAMRQWNVSREQVEAAAGKVVQKAGKHELTYGQLAAGDDAAKAFAAVPSADVTVTTVKDWKVLGTPTARPNARDLVTGSHQFPSDITRPGMLHGKILRPPSHNATLTSIDTSPAKSLKDVSVAQEEAFIAVAAPTNFAAQRAIELLGQSAKWETKPAPSSKQLFEDLRQHARGDLKNPFEAALSSAAKQFRQTYTVAYVQHAPLEPRAAVAEWEGDKLTVWTGTQNPFGVKSELQRELGIAAENIRVIVPDFGGGFGGKHSGEAAVEAARLARAVKRPVSLRWTRQEEFTWAYFRPAGVIEVEAGLDASGKLTSWHFVNINSGPSSVQTPYRIGQSRCTYVQSDPPLRHGSYRGLAATANTFARECAMDELADLAGMDPLEFRQAHLDDARLRAVLESAAQRFDFKKRRQSKEPNAGVGIACGTEKGAYIATCAEISIVDGEAIVRHVCVAFECGAVVNPLNLTAQIQGAVTMGLGPSLREEIRFSNGRIQNASFGQYQVPRFADLPLIDVQLVDRKDLPSSGAGETPLIGIAPAVANAVFHATGVRVRGMPMSLKPA